MGRPVATEVSGRERLLGAAWAALVSQHGVPGRITVASVCADAGCTAPTLYHHFTDLTDLLRAASRRAFEDWSSQLELQVGDEPDPRSRLVRRAHGYLNWARANPGAYRALFATGPQSTDAAGPGFRPLLDDVAALLGLAADDPDALAAALAHWAAVHGLASLEAAVPAAAIGPWRAATSYLLDAVLAGPVR